MEHLICAIGDLTVDVILRGLSVLPEWGQEAEISNSSMRLGGNVGNMAVGAGALHTDLQVIADIGNDQNGDFIIAEIRKLGLNTDCIRKLEGETTSKTYACIRLDGERFMLTNRGTLALIEDTVLQAYIPASKVLFLGGWCLPPRTDLERVVRQFEKWHREGRILATDLIWSDETWSAKDTLLKFLQDMDIVFLNEKELVILTDCEDQAAASEKLRDILNLRNRRQAIAVVKLGAQGSIMISGDKEYRANVYSCKPVDTVGAGDLFNLGLLHAKYQMELSDSDSVNFASTFASMFISSYGSVQPTQAMVQKAMQNNYN